MKTSKSVLYSFDSYTVDVAEGQLWRGGELVALTPKAFDTLRVLLANKGSVVSKDTLLDEVWKHTFVEESTLAQNISTLRKALGTLPNGEHFIETVPRRGYRFKAEVKEIVGEDEIIVIRHRVKTQISTEANSAAQKQSSTSLKIVSQRRIRLYAILGSLILISGIVGFYFLLWPAPMSATAFKDIQVEKLTSDGNINLVRISPDGKFLAIVERRGDISTMFLRQSDNATSIEIVPPANRRFAGLTFGNDQKSIYFTAYENPFTSNRSVGMLYSVSTLGGAVQTVASDVDSGICIAPDGQRFAFIRIVPKEGLSQIVVRTFAEGTEKVLASRPAQNGFSTSGLAWSPDGRTISAIGQKTDSLYEVVGIDTSSGSETSLNSEAWQWIGFPVWLPDGSGVVVSAYNPGSSNQTDEIWLVPYPSGKPRRITDGTSGIFGLSMRSDASSIAAVRSQLVSSFWIADAEKGGDGIKVKDNLPDYSPTFPGVTWADGERIVFAQTSEGNSDIWSIDSDGTHLKRLTTDASVDSQPVMSRDSSRIFFVSNRTGVRTLWSMRPDGSDQRQFAADQNVSAPSISALGTEIYFLAFDSLLKRPVVRRIPISGGESTAVFQQSAVLPNVSPDGKMIACYFRDASPAPAPVLKVSILSAETGELIKQFEPSFRENLSPIVWIDDTTISYSKSENNGSKIWKQSIAGGPPAAIIDSPNEKISRFAWSTDGKKVFYEKSTAINDVILISAKQK